MRNQLRDRQKRFEPPDNHQRLNLEVLKLHCHHAEVVLGHRACRPCIDAGPPPPPPRTGEHVLARQLLSAE